MRAKSKIIINTIHSTNRSILWFVDSTKFLFCQFKILFYVAHQNITALTIHITHQIFEAFLLGDDQSEKFSGNVRFIVLPIMMA